MAELTPVNRKWRVSLVLEQVATPSPSLDHLLHNPEYLEDFLQEVIDETPLLRVLRVEAVEVTRHGAA